MAGRKVIMTFGLLSPNKGIEHMIAALPTIIRCFPRLIYMVVGATHPNLVAAHGETYREKLKDQAARLGVDAHIRWVDEFLGAEELLDLLGVADVYVTPYLNPAQITSGTLAYAVGLGKPVVSTPYVHAREILANDHGRLVPFRDSTALAQQIIDLLSHPDECLTLRRRAYALGRTMIWSRLAETMMKIFERVAGPMVRLAGASEQVGRQTRSFRQAIVGAERPAIDTSHCREEKQRSSFARRTGSVGEICTLGRGEEAL